MNTKLYHVHVLEGSTIKKYIDQSQQYVEDFHADIIDTWFWGTPETIHYAMAESLANSITVDELRAELDTGANCIVIDHSIQAQTGQIIVHIINEPEVIGQAHQSSGTLQ